MRHVLAFALSCAGLGLAACVSSPTAVDPSALERSWSPTELQLADSIRWLIAHQAEDGSWPNEVAPHNTVATTSLAVLALTLDREPSRQESNKEPVVAGVKWLLGQMDKHGFVGPRVGSQYHYNQGLAAYALSEAYGKSKSFLLRPYAQRAIRYVLAARNPDKAWRYDMPPNGENDTSVTGWMVLALDAARRAGLEIDEQALAGALTWLDEVTDPATGRCGYDRPGSGSSRVARVNDQFPPESGEALTAVAVLCRELCAEGRGPLQAKQLTLLRGRPPLWSGDGLGNDFYYWYFATRALARAGDLPAWSAWSRVLETSLADAQVREREQAGSFDPVDPWGHAGGRVYSTALLTLCMHELAAAH